MKQTLTSWLFCIGVLALLTGCGGGSSNNSSAPEPTPSVAPPPAPEPVGLWTQGGDNQGLDAYRERLTTVGPSFYSTRGFAEASPAFDAGADAGASTTYTLEADVDEHDIVKYDGTILAVAPSRSGCCFVMEAAVDPLPESEGSGQPGISLYRTNPIDGTAEQLSDIPLGEDESVEGLYLVDEKLQVLMSTAWWGTFGDALTYPGYWQDQEVTLEQYDLSQADSPLLSARLTVEGALLASRRIDNHIFLVTRHSPVIEGLVPYPQTSEDVAANEALLADIDADDVLPSITIGGEPVAPLTLDDCYRMNPDHPLARELPADPSVTTLLAISADTGEIINAACSLEPISGLYVSSSHVVLTYVFYGETDTTLIHQLGITDFYYVGSAEVTGHLYTGGMLDFRISEYDGVLRLLTTTFTGDPEDQVDHDLWMLRPSEDVPELELLSRLPDESDTTELGKPNEDLYGVRFIGDRAYLVTFERIDPLYVLDLSNPLNPAVAGTLEVPGFSDLLHPVNNDLLLGVGQINLEERNFVKLELFDISDITAPFSRGEVLLGTDLSYSYSPAQYNRYAFTYRAGVDTDRFTVPYWGSIESEMDYQPVSRVALMEVRDKQVANQSALILHGETSLEDEFGVSGETRVVLDDDAIYIANDGQLWGGLWSNPEAVLPLDD